MRIFNVERADPAAAGALAHHLLPDETIHEVFSAGTTAIVFSNRRILISQVQVLLSERIETSSFSYRRLSHFALVEGTAGESRSEIKIWLIGDAQPLHLRADGGDLGPLSRLLAEKLL